MLCILILTIVLLGFDPDQAANNLFANRPQYNAEDILAEGEQGPEEVDSDLEEEFNRHEPMEVDGHEISSTQGNNKGTGGPPAKKARTGEKRGGVAPSKRAGSSLPGTSGNTDGMDPAVHDGNASTSVAISRPLGTTTNTTTHSFRKQCQSLSSFS